MTKQEEFDSIVEAFENYAGTHDYTIGFLIERVQELQEANDRLTGELERAESREVINLVIIEGMRELQKESYEHGITNSK